MDPFTYTNKWEQSCRPAGKERHSIVNTFKHRNNSNTSEIQNMGKSLHLSVNSGMILETSETNTNIARNEAVLNFKLNTGHECLASYLHPIKIYKSHYLYTI